MYKLAELAVDAQKSPDKLILDALNGNSTINEAADSLGVSRSAINDWMKKFNIQRQYVIPETKNAPESCNES